MMLPPSGSLYTVSDTSGGMGLCCTADGLALAGVPLLRLDGTRFVPRPQGEIDRLMVRTYGKAAPIMGGLQTVADAPLIGRADGRAMSGLKTS